MHRTGWARNAADPLGIDLWWDLTEPVDAQQQLLLVNGLGSPLVSYQQGFVDLLTERGFAVLRFDNRDVGKSSRVEPADRSVPYSVGDMAADAVAVLDAVGWDRPHVFGQSMGGMIAQQLAIDHSARVRTLTSLMSATGEPGFGTPTKEARTALLTSPPPGPDGWLTNRLETERIWASPAVWDPVWVEAKGREMLAHGVDAAGAARQYRAIVAGGSRDEALAKIDAPTLVMHGSADTLVTPTGGQHTAEVIPGAHYLEIDGMGHDLAPAFWDRLVSEVADFVARVS